MSRTAKRGISNATARAACAVCLAATAAIVTVSVLALAHRQADQPALFHRPGARVSIDVACDAARVSDVALAEGRPVRTGRLSDIGAAGRQDAGARLGIHAPADAPRDARADIAADAARDSLVAVRSRPGQASVVFGHSVAGPVHPSRRVAMPRMRVAHADGHAVAISAEAAERYGSVTSTRLVRSVDALGQRLPVGPAIRNQVTSLSAHGELRALDAGRLRDHADPLTAAECASKPDSARGSSPSLAKWTPEFSDQFVSILVGCSLIA
jgi:hypothetical protein